MKQNNKPDSIEINLTKCDLCGTCIGVCPPNVINMRQHDLYIDFEHCTLCSLCIDICPVRAVKGLYN